MTARAASTRVSCAATRGRFEAELEQLNAARERRRREEHSWCAQEEARQQTLAAQAQRLREALQLTLERAAEHAGFAAAKRERRRREARAVWARERDALQQRQANALAQARTLRAALAAATTAAAAAAGSESASAAALAEQVRQARLGECRCIAGGTDGHVPGCVGAMATAGAIADVSSAGGECVRARAGATPSRATVSKSGAGLLCHHCNDDQGGTGC